MITLRYWFSHVTPNDNYSGRTAPLTSKRCILYIYSTNIWTEYFKHGTYSPFFPLQNAVCFINLPSYSLNTWLHRPHKQPGCLNVEKNPLFLPGFDVQTVQLVAGSILLFTRLSLVQLHPARCTYMHLSQGVMRTGRDANHFRLLLKTKKDRSYIRWPKWLSLPFTLIRCVCLRAMLCWVLKQIWFS